MKIHSLTYQMRLAIPIERAWDFFSNPHNLELITPRELGLRLVADSPKEILPGTIIEYCVSPLFGIKQLWLTEITHVLPQVLFVDEQRFGPYRFWHHQHHFEQVENGVIVRDIVHYALPFMPCAGLFERFIIRPKLQTIFAFRNETLTRMFGERA